MMTMLMMLMTYIVRGVAATARQDAVQLEDVENRRTCRRPPAQLMSRYK